MRFALIVAAFVVVFAVALVALPTAPAAGQTIPPPTNTPDFPYPTPRPDGGPTATPDPNCPPEGCGPIPTPRPSPGPTSTPDPACPEGGCFPFPTPRPTNAPNATIVPAGPDEGIGIWHYSFMPQLGQ